MTEGRFKETVYSCGGSIGGLQGHLNVMLDCLYISIIKGHLLEICEHTIIPILYPLTQKIFLFCTNNS